MTRPVVSALYDACVLYPATLRDLLLQLAVGGAVRARWSEDIHDEWIRSVLADRPDLERARLERVRALMDLHVDEALVEGYRELIPTLILPDPDDRHVLAAAIRGGVERIVTFNVRDFPDGVLSRHGLRAQHPDHFIGALIGRAPHLVVAAARRQRRNLRRPAVEAAAFVARLGELGLEGTAHFLEGYLDSL